MEEFAEVFIVALVMGTLFGVLYSVLYFRARAYRDLHVTLRAAVDKGERLTPELVEQLGRPRDADLRRGVVSAATGVALALLAVILGEPQAIKPLLGVASFPSIIGLAYVLLWWRRQSAAPAVSASS